MESVYTLTGYRRRKTDGRKEFEVRKRIILVALVVIVIVLTVAAVSMNAAIDADDADAEAIENAAKTASLLTVSSDMVVDETGAFDETCLESYGKQLTDTFAADSGLIDHYYGLMKEVCASFHTTTSVVISNEILSFSTQSLEVNGNTATIVCDIESLQKYLPYVGDLSGDAYETVFAVGREIDTFQLVKEDDGVWRVTSWQLANYECGSPEDFELSTEDLRMVFPTRQEACAYANSLSVADICPLLK